MKPPVDVAFSLPLSFVFYYLFKSSAAALVCLMMGIFVDIDHLIDYYRFEKVSPRVSDFFNLWIIRKHWKAPHIMDKLYLVLHSYEVCIVAVALSVYLFGPLIGTAVFAGYFSHLLLDNFGNYVHPMTYFLVYRFAYQFNTEKLFTRKRPIELFMNSRERF